MWSAPRIWFHVGNFVLATKPTASKAAITCSSVSSPVSGISYNAPASLMPTFTGTGNARGSPVGLTFKTMGSYQAGGKLRSSGRATIGLCGARKFAKIPVKINRARIATGIIGQRLIMYHTCPIAFRSLPTCFARSAVISACAMFFLLCVPNSWVDVCV